MTLRIGLIGAGVMGRCHARILASEVKGAEVHSVYGPSAENVGLLLDEVRGARTCETPEALIASADIDAVVVASPDHTHVPLTLLCLAHRKPVLCEKPLAETVEDCCALCDAEQSAGRQLVQVGFMRRFDPAYRQLKAAMDLGEIGRHLFIRCIHRNRQAPSFFTGDMAITNAMAHEFDILRWLTRAELEWISVTTPSAAGLEEDPVIAAVKLSNGILAEIEIFMNAGYGYDIRTEVLGEDGVLEMARAPSTMMGKNGAVRAEQYRDFTERFADAYRIMLSEWVTALSAGEVVRESASTLDGLRAVEAAVAGVAALRSGRWENISAPHR